MRENGVSSRHWGVQGPEGVQFGHLADIEELLFKETQLCELSSLLEIYELHLLILGICLPP